MPAIRFERRQRAADEARLRRGGRGSCGPTSPPPGSSPPGRPLAGTAEAAVARAAEQARAPRPSGSPSGRPRRRRGSGPRWPRPRTPPGSRSCSASCCKADGFERWLLGSALDVLVADAGATLLELSGGQFELTHDGRDFAVVDHADADSVRPVRTLSGGETFQASLALALALSAQLAGLAAGGTARLDAIVLDEGFGTLDEATLDVVASTLEAWPPAATGWSAWSPTSARWPSGCRSGSR